MKKSAAMKVRQWDAAQMLAEIDAASPVQPQVDSEWKTREEWELVFGQSTTTVSRLIRKAVRSGLMQQDKHRRETLRGLYPTPVYRYVGKCQSTPPKPKKSPASRKKR